MSGRTAAPHGDASPLELLADRAPMNAQLGTDLAEGPTLGVQVGRMLNVHRAAVTSFAGSTCSAGELPLSHSTADNEALLNLLPATRIAKVLNWFGQTDTVQTQHPHSLGIGRLNYGGRNRLKRCRPVPTDQPDFPMPDEASYASAQDINVVQTALEELPTQYRKQHSHASSDEGSRYTESCVFNRVA